MASLNHGGYILVNTPIHFKRIENEKFSSFDLYLKIIIFFLFFKINKFKKQSMVLKFCAESFVILFWLKNRDRTGLFG